MKNHTPIGAFKVRGGLLYMSRLRDSQPDCIGVIAATRGNHGQSITFAARANGIAAVIVVPEGNSTEKECVDASAWRRIDRSRPRFPSGF